MKMQPIPVPEGLTQSRDRPFFNRGVGRRFDVHAEAGVTDIDLYDEIGFFGISAAEFRKRLKRITGDVRLRINSPGGDVFDGIAIYNDLVAHPGAVSVEVTGIAASAASLVAMAGERITIAENAFLMIHNAWILALGDRHLLGHVAGVLAQIDSALAATYAARAGIELDTVSEMMDAETWFSGAEAVEQGFADDVAVLPAPKASFDLSGFRNAPVSLKSVALSDDARPSTVRDLERHLRDAGWSRRDAQARASRAFADPAADPRDTGDGDAAFVAAFRPLLSVIQEYSR